MSLELSASSGQAFRDGMAAVYAREYDRARPLLQQAATESPDSPTVWFWLAIASPNALAAMQCLRQVVELDPKHAQAGEALGRLLVAQAGSVAQQDRARARGLLAEASRVAPDLDAVWVALAAVSDDPTEILNALRRAVRLDGRSTDLRAQLHDRLLREAVACAKNGNTADARALFREAADLDPSDVRIWQALARLAETPADAIDALRQLARIAPAQPGVGDALQKALTADARALETAGRTADVEQRWREVLAVDAHDAEATAALERLNPRPVAPPPAPPAPPQTRLAAPKPSAPAKPAAAKPPAKTAAAASGGTRHTILVVDDSATIRKILSLTLEGAGYTVVAEPDGERALQRLAEFVPDLILLDITMPKLDGYEVCKRIKKDPRTAVVPVVMLSGKDGFFDKVKGRMVGATEYLTKPFQAPAVLAVIAAHCHGTPEVSHG